MIKIVYEWGWSNGEGCASFKIWFWVSIPYQRDWLIIIGLNSRNVRWLLCNQWRIEIEWEVEWCSLLFSENSFRLRNKPNIPMLRVHIKYCVALKIQNSSNQYNFMVYWFENDLIWVNHIASLPISNSIYFFFCHIGVTKLNKQ